MSQNPTAIPDRPNPFTPMAFLSPQLAFEATLSVYVTVCTFGVFIWELVHSLRMDCKLAFKQRFSVPTAVYFLSRIATLGYLLSNSINLTAELESCRIVNQFVSGFLTASQSLSALLLFFRVRTVHDRNIFVTVFFLWAWAGLTACYALSFGATLGVSIGDTRYCMTQITHSVIQAGSWASAVYDACVLGAILYRLGGALPITSGRRVEGKLRPFTEAFLQNAQVCYIIALVTNVATLIVYYAIRGPPNSPFRLLLVVPNTAIVNIMACRVYRKTMLSWQGSGTGDWSSTLGNTRKRPPEIDLSRVEDQTFHSRDVRSFEASRSKGSFGGSAIPIGVEVTKMVEVSRDVDDHDTDAGYGRAY